MSEASLAIAGSVAMHVIWNLIARHQPRRTYALWWVLLAHLLVLAPWGWFCLYREALWSSKLVVLTAISASANATYFLGLKRAYDHAPVALVYPLVRSSTLLIAIWGWLLTGDSLHPGAWAGILASVAGLGLLASTGQGHGQRLALPWALLAMLSTSIYSLSDKAVTAHVQSFGGLLGFISVGYLASWLTLSVDMRRQTGAWVPPERPRLPVIAIGGLCVGLAYVLVVHAMRSMPAAVVVAFTNVGIVLATFASIFLFKEQQHWRRRTLAVTIICFGLLVLGLCR